MTVLASLIVSALMLFCVAALAFTARMDRGLTIPIDPMDLAEIEVPLPIPELEPL